MKQCFFAVDLGATSGRTILGTFTSNGLEMEEVNRFPNHLIEAGRHFYWDIYELYRHIIEGLRIAARKGVEITSIGIDTWGVDFVCVGKDGGFLRQPYCPAPTGDLQSSGNYPPSGGYRPQRGAGV